MHCDGDGEPTQQCYVEFTNGTALLVNESYRVVTARMGVKGH